MVCHRGPFSVQRFFLLFINDLPTVLSGCITGTDLYADDTTIYDIKKDKTIVERNLQTALNELNVWCKTNGMLLNTSKTKVMLISTRQRKHVLNNNTLSLTYDDIDLEMTNGDKILGLNINENLIWNNHFNAVSKKVSSYIWLLSQIRYLLSIEHRTLFYKAYIQPHFDYCCVIWANSSQCNISKIKKAAATSVQDHTGR